MTPADATKFLAPKWTVVAQKRRREGTALELNTGQIVIVNDDGTFHVSGKGWEAINTKLQEGLWPPFARAQTKLVRGQLEGLGLTDIAYFIEGLNCIQFAQASRAAIVLGWSGFIDLFHRRLHRDIEQVNAVFRTHFPKLSERIGNFAQLSDFEALRDKDALKLGQHLKLYDHHVYTQLDAMRDERNAYAHVGRIEPDILMALGFYSRLVRY